MKKALISLCVLLIAVTASGAPTKVIVNSVASKDVKLVIMMPGRMMTPIFNGAVSPGRNELTIDFPKETFYMFFADFPEDDIYGLKAKTQLMGLVIPGETVEMTMGGVESIVFTDKNADINTLVEKMTKEIRPAQQSQEESMNLTRAKAQDNYRNYLRVMELIEKSDLSAEQKSIVKGYIQGYFLQIIYGSINNSKVYGKMYNINVEKGYADEIASIVFEPRLDVYSTWGDIVTEVLVHRVNNGTLIINDPEGWMPVYANEIKNEGLRDKYIKYLIEREMIYKYGHDSGKMIAALKSSTKNPEVIALIDESIVKSQEHGKLNGLDVSQIVLEDAAGNQVKLGDFAGKYVFIDFWSTSCNPCIGEMPYVKAIEEKFHGKPIVFVSISMDVDVDLWKKFLKDNDMLGNQLLMLGGHKNPAERQLEVGGIPHFMLLSPDSKIVINSTYRPSNPLLALQLNSILK